MNVYCYHEQIRDWDYSEVIALWKHTWGRRGWTPVIIGINEFLKHPMSAKFESIVKAFPTINHPQFELACFRRWLAMATVGGGLLVDYDIMNRSLTPAHLPEKSGMLVLDAIGGPVPAWGDATAFEQVAHLFTLYRPDNLDMTKGQPHVSDMTIMQRIGLGSFIRRRDTCVWYDYENWRQAPLVHYSNGSVLGKGSRAQIIRETFEMASLA